MLIQTWIKHFFISLAFVCFLQTIVFAQEEDTVWRYSFRSGLNFSQTAFSENWTGGGVGSVAIGSFLNAKGNYKKNKTSWRNELQLNYGIINNQGQEARKTVDRIFFDTKVGIDISDDWNVFGSTSFLTQFAPGYDYDDDNDTRSKISDFMAPAFLTTSLGLEYAPIDYFWVRLGPFSPRLTFVTDDQIYLNVSENYGVDIGETIRYEWLAFQLASELDRDLTETINLRARYNIYANYEDLSFNKIDHWLETIFTAQITSFIDVSLGGTLIYDFDQDEDIQLSQLFTLGVLYQVGTINEE